MTKPLGITEVVLRDGHQSLLATRLRLEDMLPIAAKMDEIGFWSIESWGGATFDSCIRYLGEDPWERIRALKKAMPNTKQQMLFRGQNILGYRHYADDVVEKFVERAHVNGIDVFRIFDAMNDVRNLETSIKAAVKVGAHAQGTLSYTESPVHTLEGWLTMAKQLEDMGAHSLCIKDMAGLLKPYDAAELIGRLKETVALPIALHCHATTGLSVATHMKAIDADIDVIDTAISSMSMTYGHSPTETIVSIVEGTQRDTGLDMTKLAEVAAYFRDVREKYTQFEGSLRGIDARILLAQVPGGMLTNMESQLKEQGAADKLDEVLTEIPKVRKELGYIPLVTPTSQIVGTQAVLNVLTGERYKSITKETAGVLKGEYGKTAAPVDVALQARVLDGKEAITCRPADLLDPEMETISAELQQIATEKNITLAEDTIDDVLTYALFPQIGLKFLENRNNPDAFEPAPTKPEAKSAAVSASTSSSENTGPESYAVSVDGKVYDVVVAPGGSIENIQQTTSTPAPSSAGGEDLKAPLAGNIFKVLVNEGDNVEEGEVVLIMEAMKMETEIRATKAGEISSIHAREGDSVAVGDVLLSLV
ncbi:sodium-extruding oxaloacetate decarboxylase subunit alpha [Colwellia polaris]|jgi:oxaloacetate decarboxylase alpha subunit|uniref:sodium-extruding oxaloacetate decarboxylase subunit alpha n=1 Tax=Colwellia polaris TaxID=326537 RepID=UPI000A16D841|nr:sodium-extruding oxaloacetate decarboxylase subunit alpha [Colwellia polaris]|tara:strand:+ start:1630 stop:3405 length:1776 start_codon:yes stop_codon:yes gene_type:complete